MRHRKFGRKLGMDSTERKAMFRNMVCSLLEHGKIRTTLMRAKELRRFAEHVITLGKRAPELAGLEGEELRIAKARRVHAIRQAAFWVHDDATLQKVFSEYAALYRSRPGGYTRVVRAGFRPGDNAEMAVIALVDLPVSVAAVEAPEAAAV